MIWSAISAIFKGIGEALFGWLQRRAEDASNVQKGQLEQKVADEGAALVEQRQAAVASDAAAKSVSSDDGLRKYEQSDPNNRDNA